MTTPAEDFELSSTTLRGATVSMQYHNSQAILRSEQKNPDVVFEVYAEESGVVSGINEVMSLLRTRLPSLSSSVLSLADGDEINPGDTVISLSAPYATFGLYRDVILGLLASNTGWASAANRCVKAAGDIRIIFDGAAQIHPEVVGSMEYSAYVAGCAAVSTQIGGNLTSTVPQGSMSPEYILIWGSAERAITLYDRHTRLGVQRIIPVPTVADAIQESLDAAYSLSGRQGNPLRAVRLEMPSNLGRGSPQYATELKARLVDAGFDSVEIHLGGDLNPEKISDYVASGAPVSQFVIDRYIAAAAPARFASAIKEIDGKSIAPRGLLPGRKANARLAQRHLN